MGRRDLADRAQRTPTLTGLQLLAVAHIDAEVTQPAALEVVTDQRVKSMLLAAADAHRSMPLAHAVDELITCRSFSHADAILNAHPQLRTLAASRAIRSRAQDFAADSPAAAAELRALPDRVAGAAPPQPGIEAASTVLRRVGADFPPSSNVFLDELVKSLASRAAWIGEDATRWFLHQEVTTCPRHNESCVCLAACVELLRRGEDGPPGNWTYCMLHEAGVVLADVPSGPRMPLLRVAAALDRLVIDLTDGRHPAQAAGAKVNLAIAYNHWTGVDIEARLFDGETVALEAFEYFRSRDPLEAARAARALSANYSSRLTGEITRNRQRAIEWSERSVEVAGGEDADTRALRRSELATTLLSTDNQASRTLAIDLLRDTLSYHVTADKRTNAFNDRLNLAYALAGEPGARAEAEELARAALADTDENSPPSQTYRVHTLLTEILLQDRRGASRAAQLREANALVTTAVTIAVSEMHDRWVRHSAELLAFVLAEMRDIPATARASAMAVSASERMRAAQPDREIRVADRMGDENLYLFAAHAAAHAGRPMEALLYIERLRAREMLEAEAGPAVEFTEARLRDALGPGEAALYVWAHDGGAIAALLTVEGDAPRVTMVDSAQIVVPSSGPNWGQVLLAPAGSRSAAGSADADGVPHFEPLGKVFASLGTSLVEHLAQEHTTHLRVIAAGPLANLPWGVLIGTDGEMLALSTEMTVTPSLTWVVNRRYPKNPGPTATVIVAHTEPNDRPLPFSDAEAAAIATHGNAHTVGVPTRTAVLAALPDARILHIAVHGGQQPVVQSFSPGVTLKDIVSGVPDDPLVGPLFTARHFPIAEVTLKLANGDRLGATDIAPLALAGTEVVVLACCDSALVARHRLSDELTGLAHTFLTAGARAVIAALWTVEDDATCLLMVQLHEHLNAGSNPRQALRAAQRWLSTASGRDIATFISDRPELAVAPWPACLATRALPYGEPQHWSSFVVIG